VAECDRADMTFFAREHFSAHYNGHRLTTDEAPSTCLIAAALGACNVDIAA
jgi:hypothetical protein